MSDRPDYTLPVSIEAYTIETLPIDISAQTLGTVAIDIAAQTLGTIKIDISAQTVDIDIANVERGMFYLRNVPFINNAGFEVYKAANEVAPWILSHATRSGTAVFTGYSSLEFDTDFVSYCEQILEVPVDLAYVTALSFMLYGNADEYVPETARVRCRVTYTDGAYVEHDFDATLLTWTNCDMLPFVDTAKKLRSIRVLQVPNASGHYVKCNLDDFILVAPTSIAIVAQATNIAVDIAAQTVDINIKTSGGVNLVIDKFTQTAYLERRSTLSNDNGVTTPTAPPSSLTATTYKGKYFAILCRGMLKTLQIYCKRTGAGTLTLAYSIGPNIGEVGSVEITPGADWDWKSASVNKYWNYAPLFIWVKSCDADVSYGYDTAGDPDGHTSTDSGVTWTSEDRRYFIRALMTMQPVGVLQVGGVVNTIEIPSLTSTRQLQPLADIEPSETRYDTPQVGAGETLIVMFIAPEDVDRDDLVPHILCDGVPVLPLAVTMTSWQTYYMTTTTPGITIGVWDDVLPRYVLIVTIPYPFKRELKVGFTNTGAANRGGWVAYAYKKIS